MIWRHPPANVAPLAVQTHHHGNIFGVQFLPHSSDASLVTGAMDHTVQLHRLDGTPTKYPAHNPAVSGGSPSSWDPLRPVVVRPISTVYSCHRSRVKVKN